MDIYSLNFKKILVVVNKKELRSHFVKVLDLNEIEADFTFVDSYSDAAKMVEQEKFNQFDYIILNKKYSNRKLKDFLEYAYSNIESQKVLDLSIMIN